MVNVNDLGKRTINRQVFLNYLAANIREPTKKKVKMKATATPSIPSVQFCILINHLGEKLPLCLLLLPEQVENMYYHPPYHWNTNFQLYPIHRLDYLQV